MAARTSTSIAVFAWGSEIESVAAVAAANSTHFVRLSPSLAVIDSRLEAAALLLGAFAGSLLVASLLWRWLGSRMNRERWMRANYRQWPVICPSGVVALWVSAPAVVAVGVIVVLSGRGERWVALTPDEFMSLVVRSPGSATIAGAVAALMLLGGFGWLGYYDDTAGESDGSSGRHGGGFRWHLRRSWQRRWPTTGTVKAVGGLAIATVCVQIALWGDPAQVWDFGGRWLDAAPAPSVLGLRCDQDAVWSVWALARGALIVALSANLLNLLDRAPGRAVKAALGWWCVALVPAVLVGFGSAGGSGLGSEALQWVTWAGAVVGASTGLLRSELAEEHMLGDTGVNPLGAMLGMSTIVVYSSAVLWAVLAVLAALNLASERWSFSRIIDAVPPLRWLDRLGSPYRSY